MAPAPTLLEAFDGRRNAVGLLRLVFAGAVIVAHTWPLGGFGPSPGRKGGIDLGTFAVCCFFAVSGMLITRSAQRASLGRYAWHRFLRIMPAFLVCLLVLGFVFAPIAYHYEHGSLSGFMSASDNPVAFLRANANLYIDFYSVSGTPSTVPFPGAWDGALYTLAYELNCYLIVGGLLWLGWLRRARILIPLVAAFFWLVGIPGVHAALAPVLNEIPLGLASLLMSKFAVSFFVASALWVYAERVPMRTSWGAAAFAVAGGAWATGTWRYVGGVAIAYAVVWLMTALPESRVGRVHDLSYGVYIYGFPVQQLYAMYGLPDAGKLVYLAVATATTLMLAALSWLLVERPCLSAKDIAFRLRPRRQATPA
jgi:peptidoglycan/LPS O-acetylase OafA/YrhL